MRKIQVFTHYSGRLTNEQSIHPGVYNVGDPRLFGLEEYLVNDQKKAAYWPEEPDEPEAVTHHTMNVGDGEQPTGSTNATAVTVQFGGEPNAANSEETPENTGAPDEDKIDPDADPEDYHNWKRDELIAKLEEAGVDLSNREGSGSNGSLLKGDLVTLYEDKVLGVSGEHTGGDNAI